MQRSLVFAGMFLTIVGCGGKEHMVASASDQAPPTAKVSSVPSAAQSANAHDDEDDMVPEEASGHGHTLAPLEHQGALPIQVLLPVPDSTAPTGFPPATADDKTCTRAAGLTGKLERDFEELSTACGKNTGMKAYAKSIEGPLTSKHKHEEFSVKLAGGYCYRFFAVADGTVEKLGLRVQRSNGALHSVIQSKQPVVIYRPNQAWCRRRDRDFTIVLESLGSGEGKYAFGIYARPYEKGRAN